MRTSLVLGALAALAVAVPYPLPQEEESASVPALTVALPLSTSLDVPITGTPTLPTSLPDPDDVTSTTPTKSKNPHWEPIPVFTKECTCQLATARYPCWATDALQRCYFEENFSYGCYMAAAGGCPTPTRVCHSLFEPTPRTGRHPCELGPNPPLETSAPVVLPTSVPALPTGNVSIPLPTPSINATVSVPRVSVNATGPVVVVPTTVVSVTVLGRL